FGPRRGCPSPSSRTQPSPFRTSLIAVPLAEVVAILEEIGRHAADVAAEKVEEVVEGVPVDFGVGPGPMDEPTGEGGDAPAVHAGEIGQRLVVEDTPLPFQVAPPAVRAGAAGGFQMDQAGGRLEEDAVAFALHAR